MKKIFQTITGLIPGNYIYYVKKHAYLRVFLWGKAKKGVGEYLLNVESESFYKPAPDASLDPLAKDWFLECYNNYHNKKFYRSYILRCENCIIEPKFGWGIDSKTNKLLFDSIANNHWKEELYPSFIKYLQGKKKAKHYPAIISIRMVRDGEHNYWHFLHDILGQVILAKNELDISLPLLISKTLSEKRYFKDALAQSKQLRGINWVIQAEDEYINAEKVYFLQSQAHNPETFYNLLELLEVGKPEKEPEKRMFLKRNTKRVRSLANSTEIEGIARKFDFETVDADELSLAEQIKIFRETKYLIGIHGAGLINIIFGQVGKMVVLELFPLEYIPPHYYWLSKDMQQEYICQVGTKMDEKGAFWIEPTQFEENINKMLRTK